MTETTDRSELFLRFSRQKLIALFAIVIVVGAVGLALLLTPIGPAWRSMSLTLLVPVSIAVLAALWFSLRGRRWNPDSPEVKIATEDEWRRTNMDRATRAALIVALVAQYPLALMFGMFLPDLAQPRPAFAMAFSTITLALAVQIGLFLSLDRE
jgi:predicted signal transduction protein with EAL and GGDEF domain